MKHSNNKSSKLAVFALATMLAICVPLSAFAAVTPPPTATPPATTAPTTATPPPSAKAPTPAPAASSTPTPPATSTPTPPAPQTGTSIYISAYNIVDSATGGEILNLYPDMKCLAAFTIVDERIKSDDIPADADLTKYVHARVVSDNFTPVSGGDVRYRRREGVVDGANKYLSYTVSFNDTSYKGLKNLFSFDLSTTTV
ncbi:MAG: hypothetical protein RR754_07385, partial [Oscillospiraceae bacterium]